jgi:predicted Zn-dependent peptidase
MEMWRLSNGIKVLFKKTNGLKIASINIFSRGGVLCEDAQKTGIGNFTPMSMTRATMSRSIERMALDIADLGASFEASGDYDYAGFSLELLSEKFVKAVEIVSDILINPAFNPEEIEKDKAVVCASIDSKKESIKTLSLDYFIKRFYKDDDAYSHAPSGTIETISSINRDDLIAWHKAAYNVENIMITVVGNVSTELARETFEKYFSPICRSEELKRHSCSQTNEEGVHYFDEQFDQAYIVVGYPAPNLFSPNFMATKLLSTYLGGRMSSKLFVELREKMGLAYELGSICPSRLERSFFGIYIGLDKKNIDIALKRIDEIVKETCLEEISQDELDNVKSYVKGIHVLEGQTVKSLCFQYGVGEFIHNDYKYYEKYIDNMMKLTPKDLLEAANETFKHKPTTVILRSK